MKEIKRQYHHGNLAEGLRGCAFDVVSTDGIEALSLRNLGKSLGVSRSAVYHHYKSKDALLAAIAVQGFDVLDQQLVHQINAPSKNAQDRLEDALVAYVKFVKEHRAVYELMFGYKLWNSEMQETVASRAWFSFLQLKNFVSQLQLEGVRKDANIHRLTQVTWAFVHGLGALAGDRILQDSDEIEQIAREATIVFLSSS